MYPPFTPRTIVVLSGISTIYVFDGIVLFGAPFGSVPFEAMDVEL